MLVLVGAEGPKALGTTAFIMVLEILQARDILDFQKFKHSNISNLQTFKHSNISNLQTFKDSIIEI